METGSAIVFLPREGDRPSRMLEPILFDPAALWLCEDLKRAGVEHFLVVCHHKDRERAAACFPDDALLLTEGVGLEDEFQMFLKTPGRVMVFTEPVFLCDEAALAEGRFDLTEDQRQAVLNGTPLREVYRQPEAPEAPTLGEDLSALAGRAQAKGVARLQAAGVRVLDPRNAYVGPQVTAQRGGVILPGTILRGATHLGKNAVIGPNTMLVDTTVGEGTAVNASQCLESAIGAFTSVGPFAYLRPGTVVGDHVRVGDFVELKNTQIGNETKISHLAYLGDCDVGEGSDIGCGTVTVNFDGEQKFRTQIGDDAFIGCNTNLIAPVSVGHGAYVAAGSTITRDVPSDSLAIARSTQTVKHNWAKKRRAKQGKNK